VQKWRLVNHSLFTHYVHIHAQQWRTVTRNGRTPPPWERGLEDTWKLDPGEVVEVAARFTDHTGVFMVHCHMLDHEDHGMMARFRVVDPGLTYR
jgi:spore coat protein A